jgi:hypothetical protein
MTPSIETMRVQGLKPGDVVKLRLKNEGAVSSPPSTVIDYGLQLISQRLETLKRVQRFPADYPPTVVYQGINGKGQAELNATETDSGIDDEETPVSEFSTEVDPKADRFEGFLSRNPSGQK